MPEPLIVPPNEAPSPLKMVGEEITVLAPGDMTGSYEIFHQSGPEGSGPPPHHHPWDEAFYVLEGEITFGIGADEGRVAEPGTLVHLPGGTTHWFQFGAGGGRMISITSRAGAAQFFTEVDRKISPTDPDFGALVGIATANGLSVGLPGS